MKNVKVYTNSSFNDTIEIVSYLQPVTYHIVLGVNFFADFLSSFSDFFGGKSQSYQSRLASINNEVIEGIKQKVYSIGGNAAIDLKIDNDEISAQGKSMIMVTAIATAVIIREKAIRESSVKPLSKGNMKAITFEEFSRYQKKMEIIKTLMDSKNIGPINRLNLDLEGDNIDVIHYVFKSINQGEFNPKDFTKESLNSIKNILNSMDYESRSKILYENLKYVLDENNEIIYRINKTTFYIEVIEEFMSVDYHQINMILPIGNKLSSDKIVNHYVRGLNNKSIFFPEDIDLLRSGLKILESLEDIEEEYFEKFQQTIHNLEKLFE